MSRPHRPLLAALCALLVLALAPAAGAQVSARVVNGTPAADGELPWTVALVQAGRSPAAGQFCGGTLLATDVVLTAAHCVAGTAPASLDVLARETVLSRAGGHRIAVAEIAVHPAADVTGEGEPGSDLALLRLTAPVPGAQPIALVAAETAPPDASWGVGTPLEVAGWGRMAGGRLADVLQRATLTRTDDGVCAARYPGAFRAADMVCAGVGPDGRDACQGDSGGPLAVAGASRLDPSGWRLVGVVSWGPSGCGLAGSPGVYARVAATALRAFAEELTDADGVDPVFQPWATAEPVLTGTVQAGEVVACSPGAWRHGPDRLLVGLVDLSAERLLAAGQGGVAHRLGAGEVGHVLGCQAVARNAGGGFGVAASAPSGPVAPAPAPALTPAPAPTPAPALAPAPAPALDVARPRARVAARTCRARRCTLRITIADPAPSAGIARLDARLCTAPARCRTLAVRLAGATFVVTTPRLAPGRAHTVRLVATDRAGHRQHPATMLRLRVG